MATDPVLTHSKKTYATVEPPDMDAFRAEPLRLMTCRRGTPDLQSALPMCTKCAQKISEELRKPVQRCVEELLSSKPADRCDLILFRNVSIYLEPEMWS